MHAVRRRDVPEAKYKLAFLGFEEEGGAGIELTYNYGDTAYEHGFILFIKSPTGHPEGAQTNPWRTDHACHCHQAVRRAGRASVEVRPDPQPQAGLVLIEVKAFGINHAETHMREGKWPEAGLNVPAWSRPTLRDASRRARKWSRSWAAWAAASTAATPN
jgi:hypothetical protein